MDVRVDVYLRVRRAVMVEGMSIQEASRVFGQHRDTVSRMLAYSVPPGCRRTSQRGAQTLRETQDEPDTGVIDRILDDDHRVPRKQRHMVKRIYERLRDEYAFAGRYTIVNDRARKHRRSNREMFVPLSRPPAHIRHDFGDALVVVVEGVEQKAHLPADADH